MGLSPRGRGKPSAYGDNDARQRSIPAWAGETRARCNRVAVYAVYPRVGGGNKPSSVSEDSPGGLSPRGRGKLGSSNPRSRRLGSIPAWAGETCRIRRAQRRQEVYPRVGGGNKPSSVSEDSPGGLSPRGRGKHHASAFQLLSPRSIPAWAGETCPDWSRQTLGMVYPRVGGGNRVYITKRAPPNGLSPRGRGKRAIFGFQAISKRSIPAWAGETQYRLGAA